MSQKINFDTLLAMHQEAMRMGHGSKPWILFATEMADCFPRLYATAKAMNLEALQMSAHRAVLLSALDEALVAMRAFLDPEGNMPATTGEFNDLRRALIHAERAVSDVKGGV